MMPAHERSTFGCWTCRIRKKKCDEKYPICEACYARSITCYGYGPKPEWMDGGEKERKVLHELKREVKENLKQRKASGSVIPPPIPTGGFSSMYGGSWPSQSRTISNLSYLPPPLTAIQSCPTSLSPGYQDSVSDDPTFPIPAQAGDCGASDTNSKSNDLESTLLMNYLDHVFPLQFNCYVPPVVELGRGWLLALLTRTKPLYHAALAISAFYMHSVILKTGRSRTRCMNNHWEAMKIHHALAFQELQIQISASNHGEKVASLKESIEILACIIQLVSFELLRGGTDSWQVHLKAASSIIPALTVARKTVGISTISASASYAQRLDQGDLLPDVDEIACDFLVGSFIWFDIISCASTRSKPFLENNFEYISNIELDKVMGCENWVMILIAKISLLEEWKRDMQKAGRLSVVELSARGSELENQLNSELASRTLYAPTKPFVHCPTRHTSIITRIFAYSALIYLHTVISGAHPDLAEIKTSVSMTITAFSNLPTPRLLQNLVWPFCVVGCMASRDIEPCCANLVLAAEEDAKCLGNYRKAFEVIRECWRLREIQGEEDKAVDWTMAMESLGFRALLI